MKKTDMKITEFHIELSKENVLAAIDVSRDSDLYEEIEYEFEEMLPQAYEKIQPAALLAFGDISDYEIDHNGEYETTALFGINSVGRGLSEWSTQLFAEGDYLKGMLADAMADNYLFQMDQAVQDAVVEMCREKAYGIVRRLEAPQDIPISIQKRAFDATDAAQEIGLGIKESFMYDPVKTVCQVYVLDRNISRFHNEHDCSKCDNLTCRFRKIPKVSVTLKSEAQEHKITAEKGKTLMQTLQEKHIFISAVCAGRGVCGKCRVRVLEGNALITEADRKFFCEEELREGFRLACRLYPQEDMIIELENREDEGFSVITDQEEGTASGETDSKDLSEQKTSGQKSLHGAAYGIAVDIGTTTIAMQLVDLESAEAVDIYTAINRQRSYGADVISRIEASNTGAKQELQQLILQELQDGICSLTDRKNIALQRMVIAGNTTMIHLLMGYSCETLGVYPFTPVNIETVHTTYQELFGKLSDRTLRDDFPITVCPGISTYVGGDITAGMYALGFEQLEKTCVLIDLGTNGEMVIGNKERILAASTAAGPAFEGGNIICGTGSIPGAICSVELTDGDARVATINDRPAVGICGTGVIDAVSELMRAEIIDETGLMEEPYFKDGFLLARGEREIWFFQKDVREIQLAKSAVRAGLETLISRYGVSYEDIDRIYIAGGFGYKMDVHKAVGIGLLPAECEEKITAVGNTSLKGARKSLTESSAFSAMQHLKDHAEEVSLSDDKLFQTLYMEHMFF